MKIPSKTVRPIIHHEPNCDGCMIKKLCLDYPMLEITLSEVDKGVPFLNIVDEKISIKQNLIQDEGTTSEHEIGTTVRNNISSCILTSQSSAS